MHGTLVFSIVSTHFSYVELLNITWKDNYRLPNVLVLSAVVLGDIVTHVLLYSYIGLVCMYVEMMFLYKLYELTAKGPLISDQRKLFMQKCPLKRELSVSPKALQ